MKKSRKFMRRLLAVLLAALLACATLTVAFADECPKGGSHNWVLTQNPEIDWDNAAYVEIPGNKDQHRCEYDAYYYYECTKCHDRGSGHPGDPHVENEDHSWEYDKEELTKTEYAAIDGNAQEHTVTDHYKQQKKCEKCGAMGDPDIWSDSWEDPHEYDADGVCKLCGFACPHSNGTEVVINHTPTQTNVQPIDDIDHSDTVIVSRDTVCKDCGKVMQSVPLTQTEEAVGHDYDPNNYTCTVCGHVCTHSEGTYVVDDDSATDYDHPTRVETINDFVCKRCFAVDKVTYCEACNKELGRQKGESENIGSHEFEDDDEDGIYTCWICKFVGDPNKVCAHPNCTEEENWDCLSITEIPDDDVYHLEEMLFGSHSFCNICYSEFNYKSYTESRKEEHVYTDDGICVECGHERGSAPVPAAAAASAAAYASAATATSAASSAPAPAVQTELTFDVPPETGVVSGVKASDSLPMAQALAIIGQTLDAENVTVEIPNIDQVLTPEELEKFNKLNVQERLMVALVALGFRDVLDAALADDPNLLSPDALALVESIKARLDAMTPDEQAKLAALLPTLFAQEKVEIDGVEYDCFCIDLVIAREGKKEYQRFAFRQDEAGKWILCQIKIGEFRPV